MERLDDYDDGRRWCGRVSVVEGKERGRELLGEQVQVKATGGRTGDERGGRKRTREGRAEQNTGLLEQTARARVDEWGTERDWGGMGGWGWMGGWMDYGARMG